MEPILPLLRYAAPHRMLIAGALLAMLVYGAASAAQAWLIKPIIDDVLQAQSSLRFVAVAIVVAYFFKGIGAYFSSYLMDDLGHRVVMRLRNDLFRHLLDQSAAFFARRTTGGLLSRINNDVGQLHRAVAETVGDLARETLALVGESGSGKSVSALSILQLLPYPHAKHPKGSSIQFRGEELAVSYTHLTLPTKA